MSTPTHRRMARIYDSLDAAARHAAAAREAEAQAADAPAGCAGQRGLQMAARCLQELSAFNISQAGRVAAGKAR